MARASIGFAVVFLATSSGCGTYSNLVDSGCFTGRSPPEKVYGGLILDCVFLGEVAKETVATFDDKQKCSSQMVTTGFLPEHFPKTCNFIGPVVVFTSISPFIFLDMPLSAVADTLTLPLTLRATLERYRSGTAAVTDSPGPQPKERLHGGIAPDIVPGPDGVPTGQRPREPSAPPVE